jgi:hypothetical protein
VKFFETLAAPKSEEPKSESNPQEPSMSKHSRRQISRGYRPEGGRISAKLSSRKGNRAEAVQSTGTSRANPEVIACQLLSCPGVRATYEQSWRASVWRKRTPRPGSRRWPLGSARSKWLML